MRLALVPAFAAVVIAALGCAAGEPRRTALCETAVRYDGAQGAMGQIVAVFVVTPRNPPCRLRGFPSLTLVGSAHAVPSHEGHGLVGFDYPTTTVRLAPGSVAHFAVQYFSARPGYGQLCSPEVRSLRVRMPGFRRSQLVRLDLSGADARVFNPCGGRFQVGPIEAG